MLECFTFFLPVDHILSECFTMTCPSLAAMQGMAHSFTELHKLFHYKTVIHKIFLLMDFHMIEIIWYVVFCGFLLSCSIRYHDWSMCQYVLSYGEIIFIDIICFIYPLLDNEHFHCFYLLACMNNASKALVYKLFNVYEYMSSSFLGIYLGVDLLNHMEILCLNIEKLPDCLLEQAKLLGEAHWPKPPTLARHHNSHLHELSYDRRSW